MKSANPIKLPSKNVAWNTTSAPPAKARSVAAAASVSSFDPYRAGRSISTTPPASRYRSSSSCSCRSPSLPARARIGSSGSATRSMRPSLESSMRRNANSHLDAVVRSLALVTTVSLSRNTGPPAGLFRQRSGGGRQPPRSTSSPYQSMASAYNSVQSHRFMSRNELRWI